MLATARPGTSELKQFGLHVIGDARLVAVLHVAAVDAERRLALLVMTGERGGQVHGAGPLRPVQAPDRLGNAGRQVNRFRSVAPAGRDRDAHAHALARELFLAVGGLGKAPNGSVGDHDLDGQAARVAHVGTDQFGRVAGHRHGLSSSDSRTPP
jgi:hypothetical protein